MIQDTPELVSPASLQYGPTVKIGSREYYTVHSLANSLEVPSRHLVNLVRSGAFPGRKIGLVYLLPCDGVQEWLSTHALQYSTRKCRENPISLEFEISKHREEIRLDRIQRNLKYQKNLEPVVIGGIEHFTLRQIATIIGVQNRILIKEFYGSGIKPQGVEGLVSMEAFDRWIRSDKLTVQARPGRRKKTQ